MNRAAMFLAPVAMLALSGCLAKAAVDVVTAPVRLASGAVDMATTSQSEADENRGRELRRREEQLGRLEREWRELDEDCRDGDRRACERADAKAAEIDALRPSIPQRYDDQA